MDKKICLITGGNAGIGKATATGLAHKGYEVIIVCRAVNKAEEAVKDIIAESGNHNVSYLLADLSSQKQVRQLAADFQGKYNRLDVLINNAGAFFSQYGETEDGIERQWAINHLAPFLLTNLLLPLLKQSAPARIVNVASEAHYRGKINFDDLGYKQSYEGFLKAYSQSKLANVLFTYELARQLKGTNVTATCLHPGVVSTDIVGKNASGFYKFGWALMSLLMITPAKGAATSIYLASSPEVEGVSGQYFDKSKPKKPNPAANDEVLGKRLWDVSLALVGLK